ncbi:MAG: phytoene/squalene synthase family protein [Verrucomicrobiota bacterium]
MSVPEQLIRRIPNLPVDKIDDCLSPPEELRESFQNAKETTRKHAKSFYFASHFLTKAKRMEAYAAYGYCRYIDDLIDEASPSDLLPSREKLLADNRTIISGEHPAPFAAAFGWVCKHRRIPVELLDELVEGCYRDTATVRIKTEEELWEYCYLVASVVGLMMCRVFGVSSQEAYPRAVAMGLAMQLTNILRDIKEDFENGRIYLPEESLHARNLSVSSLIQNGPSSDWKDYIDGLIQKARGWYKSAEEGLLFLLDKKSAKTAKTMGRVYAGILTEIEKNDYDIRERRFVSLSRKIGLALKR